jgi:hypothetical protein
MGDKLLSELLDILCYRARLRQDRHLAVDFGGSPTPNLNVLFRCVLIEPTLLDLESSRRSLHDIAMRATEKYSQDCSQDADAACLQYPYSNSAIQG